MQTLFFGMSFSRATLLFFILLSCSLSANGGYTDVDAVLKQSNVLSWRYAAIKKQDAVFGDIEPYVKFEFVIDKSDSSFEDNHPPNPEMVLFHSDMRSQIARHNNWCCTKELKQNNVCSQENQLNFEDPVAIKFSQKQGDEFMTSENNLMFYWRNFKSYDLHNLTNSITVSDSMNITKTGVWYLVLAHCNNSYDVTVTGVFEWKNPFGYLSGTIFGYLPMYAVLTSGFLGLIGGWSYFMHKYKKNLMGLQYATTAAIISAFIESALWTFDYLTYNNSGRISDPVNVVGALLTSTKLTLIRTLILLVSLGYSITSPDLERQTKIIVAVLTLSYYITSTTNEYLWVLKTMGIDVHVVVEIVVLGLLSVLNMLYVIWISKSLLEHYKNLQQLKQTEKLSMYTKFSAFLGVFIALSMVFFLVQFAVIASGEFDRLWQIWWIWDGYWEIGYFLVVLLIAKLWMPNENNERYAYSVQIGADGTAMDDIGVGLGSDSSGEENADETGGLKQNKKVPLDDVDSEEKKGSSDDEL